MNPAGAGPSNAVLSSLEFAAVIHGIAALATSEPGREAILALRPRLGEGAWARAQLNLVEDAVGFFQAGGDYGFAGAVDNLPLVERAEKGSALPGIDLRRLADTERSLRTAVAALDADQRPVGPLRALAKGRARTDDIIAAIDRAVEEEGRIADGAS